MNKPGQFASVLLQAASSSSFLALEAFLNFYEIFSNILK
jgi:hypothetical protein